jgi:hypothetical protein
MGSGNNSEIWATLTVFLKLWVLKMEIFRQHEKCGRCKKKTKARMKGRCGSHVCNPSYSGGAGRRMPI